MMWVTLLATTNSRSYSYKVRLTEESLILSSYLRSEFISYEKSILNLNGSYHVVWQCHHLLLLSHLLLMSVALDVRRMWAWLMRGSHGLVLCSAHLKLN
jgi:hypothetical protein